MTATCRETCCSVTPRLSVSELFERGFRRRRDAPLPIEGAPRRDRDGNFARFSLEIAEGRIGRVGFQSSSCATLIAYCELIAETLSGFPCEIARELTAKQIIDALPGVPAYKQERSLLALAAVRAALDSTATEPRGAAP